MQNSSTGVKRKVNRREFVRKKKKTHTHRQRCISVTARWFLDLGVSQSVTIVYVNPPYLILCCAHYRGRPSVLSIAMELPMPASFPAPSKDARVRWTWRLAFGTFLRRLNASAPSDTAEFESSGENFSSSSGTHVVLPTGVKIDEASAVDEVVVNNSFFHKSPPSSFEKSGGTTGTEGTSVGGAGAGSSSGRDGASHSSFWDRTKIGSMLRWRTLPACNRFFNPTFDDRASEAAYTKEQWYTHKRLALITSLFFILNQILAIITLHRPWSTL
jgi:hypothetical protein